MKGSSPHSGQEQALKKVSISTNWFKWNVYKDYCIDLKDFSKVFIAALCNQLVQKMQVLRFTYRDIELSILFTNVIGGNVDCTSGVIATQTEIVWDVVERSQIIGNKLMGLDPEDIEDAPDVPTVPKNAPYGDWYSTPTKLHLACEKADTSPTTIKALIDENSEDVRKRNKNGELPLHVACANIGPNTIDIIKLLLETYPGGLYGNDSYRKSALHLVCSSASPLAYAVAKYLLDLYPYAAQYRTKLYGPKNGNDESPGYAPDQLPLHVACSSLSPSVVDLVKLLVEKFPKAVDESDDKGNRAVHMACESSNPLAVDVVKHFLKVGSEMFDVTNMPGQRGRLPLHAACRSKNPHAMELVKVVLDAGKKAAKVTDRNKAVPLHYLCENPRITYDTFKLLLKAFPEAASKCTMKGGDSSVYRHRFPLHEACRNENMSVEIIKKLLECKENPDDEDSLAWGIRDMDRNSMRPLHYACQNAGPQAAGIVKELLNSYFEGITESGPKDRLPIHFAALNEGPCGLEIFQQLLQEEECSDRISDSDSYGQMVVHFVCRNKGPFAVQMLKELENFEMDLSEACDVTLNDDDDESIMIKNLMPVHFACANEGPDGFQLLQALLEDSACCENLNEYTQYVQVDYDDEDNNIDKPYKLPLHYACENKGPNAQRMVELILEKCPEESNTDYDECTPLQIASKNVGPSAPKLVDILIPLSSFLSDKQIRTTVENICLNESTHSLEMLKSIVDQHAPVFASYALKVLMEKEEFTTLDEDKVLFIVLKNFENLVTGTCVKDLFHWTQYLHMGRERHINILIRILKLLKTPKAIQEASYHRDEEKRCAVDIPIHAFKKLIFRNLYFCGRYKIYTGAPIHESATAIVFAAKDFFADVLYGRLYDTLIASKIITSSAEWNKKVISLGTSMCAASSSAWQRVCDAMVAEPNKSKDVFVKQCMEYCGDSVEVVIKFMKHEDQYNRECNIRQAKKLDPSFVVSILPGPTREEFSAAVQTLEIEGLKGKAMSDYQFGIVLPAADRSLESIIRQEKPDQIHIRAYIKELGQAVEYLHSQGIIHGDLKMLNVVRIHGRLHLIDLDACAVFGSPTAAKFSSGVLPPELFKLLDVKGRQEFENYWRASTGLTGSEWVKIAPAEFVNESIMPNGALKKENFYVVVRTFNVHSEAPSPAALYDLVPATAQFDIWSFGLILLKMCCKMKSFVSVDVDDDLIPEDMGKMATLTQNEVDDFIETNVRKFYPAAADLLKVLLSIENRPKTMTDVLNHSFFTTEVNMDTIKHQLDEIQKVAIENSKQLTQISINQDKILLMQEEILKNTLYIRAVADKIFCQIRRTEKVLRKAMFESTEVMIPTCFVILNQNLSQKAATAAHVSASAKDKEAQQTSCATGWLKKLERVSSVVNKAVSVLSDPTGAVTEYINDICHGESLYFYFIDEYTMEPVAEFPIEIKTPADFIPKVLPLMRASLQAASFVNKVAGIGRCFGYPIPTISNEAMSYAEQAVGAMSVESSVAQFQFLQKCADEAAKSSKSATEAVRGANLRDLQVFYTENNTNNFAGLRRVCTEHGSACWTTDDNAKLMETDGMSEETALTAHPAADLSTKQNQDASLSEPAPTVSLVRKEEPITTVVAPPLLEATVTPTPLTVTTSVSSGATSPSPNCISVDNSSEILKMLQDQKAMIQTLIESNQALVMNTSAAATAAAAASSVKAVTNSTSSQEPTAAELRPVLINVTLTEGSSVTIDPTEEIWEAFVDKSNGEQVLMYGSVSKPNPLGVLKLARQLILTNHKLTHIDPIKLDTRGSFPFDKKMTVVAGSDGKSIKVTVGSSVTRFYPIDGKKAEDWVGAIQSAMSSFGKK